jgi:hypothetical protein
MYGATNWNLVDKSGNQVYLRTSSFADFATKIVPKGSGKVRGILTKFGTDYQLLPRSEKCDAYWRKSCSFSPKILKLL